MPDGTPHVRHHQRTWYNPRSLLMCVYNRDRAPYRRLDDDDARA
ncbi:hypothetical protein [Streptomyces sp. NPDC048438]